MTNNNEKLLVSWKGPSSRENYFVGLLSKNISSDTVNYNFIYNKQIVHEAEKEGFVPFVGLKDIDKKYFSEKLFSIFERRLPNRSRNVLKKFVNENQLHGSDIVMWEYLKVTKGKTATDNLSFLEPFIIEGNQLSYTGEIAGWSFTESKNKSVEIDRNVTLVHDKTNANDVEAVKVLDAEKANNHLGYIQKPFNKVFCSLLKKGYFLEGIIKSIDEYDGRPTIALTKEIVIKDIEPEFQHLIDFRN